MVETAVLLAVCTCKTIGSINANPLLSYFILHPTFLSFDQLTNCKIVLSSAWVISNQRDHATTV